MGLGRGLGAGAASGGNRSVAERDIKVAGRAIRLKRCGHGKESPATNGLFALFGRDRGCRGLAVQPVESRFMKANALRSGAPRFTAMWIQSIA